MLGRSDVTEILSLLNILEQVPDQRSFLELLIRGLESLLHISSAVYLPYDRHRESFRIDGHVVFNLDPTIFRDYVGYYNTIDPFITTGWFKSDGPLVAFREDLVPPSVYYASEFAVDFLSRIPAKYDMGLRFIAQGDILGALGVHRREEEGNFTERERKIAEVLVGPLSEMFHRREFVSGPDPLSGPDLGVLVADASGTMIYGNSLARKVIEDSTPASIIAAAKGTAPVYLRSCGGVYRARSFPLTPQSAFFVENRIAGYAVGKSGSSFRVLLFEPASSDSVFQKRLAASPLTPRQRRVVEKVLLGWTNREIATLLGITEQTVKDHLHDIFEKFHLRNRVELTTLFKIQPDLRLENKPGA